MRGFVGLRGCKTKNQATHGMQPGLLTREIGPVGGCLVVLRKRRAGGTRVSGGILKLMKQSGSADRARGSWTITRSWKDHRLADTLRNRRQIKGRAAVQQSRCDQWRKGTRRKHLRSATSRRNAPQPTRNADQRRCSLPKPAKSLPEAKSASRKLPPPPVIEPLKVRKSLRRRQPRGNQLPSRIQRTVNLHGENWRGIDVRACKRRLSRTNEDLRHIHNPKHNRQPNIDCLRVKQ